MKSQIENLKQVSQRILAEAKSQGAQMASCSVTSQLFTEVYYEGGRISLVRSCLSDDGSVKLLVNQQKGVSSLTDFSDETIAATVREALEAASVSQPDPAEGVSELERNQDFVSGPQEADTEKMIAATLAFYQALKADYPKVEAEGFSLSHELNQTVYANSNGVLLSESKGAYSCGSMIAAREGTKTTSFDGFGGIIADLNTPLIDIAGARRKFEEIQKQLDTRTFEGSFVGDLILPPNMLGEILFYMQRVFLSDTSLITGLSAWKDKLGEQLADSRLTVMTDPAYAGLAGACHITPDGYVSKPQTLINKGKLQSFSLTRYGAAKTGGKRSGNSSPSFIVEPGDKSVEELIGSVKRGLILNRFSGGNPSASGDLTGVAKNSFLIEDGKITDAVTETMISFNIAEMLNSIEGISSELENSGSRIVPWMCVSGITISGK